MGLFTKLCAIPVFFVGLAAIGAGLIGLFMPLSLRLNISIPAVYGVVFSFLGWGMLRPITLAWRRNARPDPRDAKTAEHSDLRA